MKEQPVRVMCWATCIVMGVGSATAGGDWEAWLTASFVIVAMGFRR